MRSVEGLPRSVNEAFDVTEIHFAVGCDISQAMVLATDVPQAGLAAGQSKLPRVLITATSSVFFEHVPRGNGVGYAFMVGSDWIARPCPARTGPRCGLLS
jgi:hypothetical protein